MIEMQGPISPELVLVFPEAREQAIALLPDFSWQTFVARARVQADAPEQEGVATLVGHEVRGAISELVMLVPWGFAAFACVTLVTFTLTVIANATR